MNGRPWLPAHTATLTRMRGRPIDEIAAETGHCRETVARHLRAMGWKSYTPRKQWTRRDWLLHDAAGLSMPVVGCGA
jgi:CO/xanthine dehydrogenase Mo-binding subunit